MNYEETDKIRIIEVTSSLKNYKTFDYPAYREKMIWDYGCINTPIYEMSNKDIIDVIDRGYKENPNGSNHWGRIAELFSIELAVRGIDTPIEI